MPPVHALGLLALLAALASPGAGGARLPLGRPDVVWLDGGRFLRGARPSDVAYGVALCHRGRSGLEALGACAAERFRAELPARSVWVSAFGIDRTEVTLGAWGRCVRANVCPPPRLPPDDPRVSGADRPVAGVTWEEAARYCGHVGGRLPTEAEWERAARGASPRRRFPWGRFYHPRLSNHGGADGDAGLDGWRHAAPVGAFPDGASPYGLEDVAGNVWEWTADRFDPAGHVEETVDPRGAASGAERVIRGGSWASDAASQRVTERRGLPERASSFDVGLRCAYDPPSHSLPSGGAGRVW